MDQENSTMASSRAAHKPASKHIEIRALAPSSKAWDSESGPRSNITRKKATANIEDSSRPFDPAITTATKRRRTQDQSDERSPGVLKNHLRKIES